MTRIAGHCSRCGIDLDPCPFCSDELAGRRRPLAPSPNDPLRATDAGGVPSSTRGRYSALAVERRRPPLALWRAEVEYR